MNIAVIVNKGQDEGGAFQYALSLSRLLEENRSANYNFIFFTTVRKNIGIFKRYGLRFNYLRWSNINRFTGLMYNSVLLAGISAKLRIRLESRIDRILTRYNIDLAYFLGPSDIALAMNFHNYILTVWDLCFLDFMEFPEVYVNKEFERRDNFYRMAIPKAVAVITDSAPTRENIVRKYGAKENRIFPLSFLPFDTVDITEEGYRRGFIDIRKKYSIAGDYIFYPAQFWPHKNHVYILNGLKLLKEKYNIDLHAVFCGSDKGNLSFVMEKSRQLGMADRVHYIGFADDKEMLYLYKQALALVMPTYFGPTNIPPLEAFSLSCPVLYPDLPGLSEQVRDSAILLDLNRPETMCGGLLKIIKKSPEINAMVENGRKKIERLSRKDNWQTLKAVFDSYSVRLGCRR